MRAAHRRTRGSATAGRDEVALFAGRAGGPGPAAARDVASDRHGGGLRRAPGGARPVRGGRAAPGGRQSSGEIPARIGLTLLPFASPEIATVMADWLTTQKPQQARATAWLTRHPDAAARALVPPALGKRGAARRRAEHALTTLVDEGSPGRRGKGRRRVRPGRRGRDRRAARRRPAAALPPRSRRCPSGPTRPP